MSTFRIVQARLDDARSTDAAIATHADEAAEALFDALAPHLAEGEALTGDTLRLVLDLVRRRYAAAADALADAAGGLADESGQDASARSERNAARDALFDLVSRFKAAVRARYGEAFLGQLPLSGQTPRQADRLLAEADQLVSWLDDPDTAFPASDDPFAPSLTKPHVRGEAAPAADRLRVAVAAVGAEGRETEAALLDKDAALDTFDEARRATRTLLKGVFRSVGRADVADRI